MLRRIAAAPAGAAIMAISTAALSLLAGLSPATADGAVPGWMTVDTARKSVGLELVAGWNRVNNALNFNGYAKGGMTVVLPVGWTVAVSFINRDSMMPHSLLVTRDHPPDAMPPQAGKDAVAIANATTADPLEGLPPDGTERLEFTTTEPGDYDLLCGVPAHATGGMWVKMRVDGAVSEPSVVVAPEVTAGRT